jgi:glycine/D-amino acid oxidase-like deaminating enzyme
MSVSYWLDRAKACSPQRVDAVIIGAGIAGHSSAYWLQKEFPDFKIAVLEKGLRGSGATGRNAGFITCGSVEHFSRLVQTHGEESAREMWQYSEKNLSLLKEELNLSLDKHGFEQKGSFSLASSEHELKELKESALLMKKLNISVEVLDEKECAQRLGCVGFKGGVKYCDDASINPLLLIDEIHCRISPHVSFYENHEVFSIEKKGQTRLVRTNQGNFEADVVIMATNGYSALLHPFFKGKIEPTRGQILATEAVAPFMEGPSYANFVLDYFRQLPSGELIIGGFRQLDKQGEVGYSDETNPTIHSALEKFIEDHLPRLKSKKITHKWSGVMGFSFDGQPIIGSLADDPQVYFLGGFTAHGLGLAFHGAKTLCDILQGRSCPEFLNARRI